MFDFYIDKNIHIALSVISLMLIQTIQQGCHVDSHLIGFIFCGVVLSYGYLKKQLRFSFFYVIIFCFCCFFFIQLSLILKSFSLGLVILVICYKFKFRQIPFLKIGIVAFCWSFLVVGFPFAELYFLKTYFLLWLQIFIYVIVLILPFEIRDIPFDKHLRTLPNTIGVFSTKIIGTFLMGIFCLISWKLNQDFNLFLKTDIIISIIAILLLTLSETGQSKYYCSFWVESLPIWHLLLIQFFMFF